MKLAELLKSIAQLTAFQKKQLEGFLIDAFRLNEEEKNRKPDRCPHCHKESRVIKKGFNKGKQRFQCKDCLHLYTFDSHTITTYLKIERSMFQRIVLDILNCIPIKQTTVELDVSIQCVFENRHIKRAARKRGDPSNFRGLSHEQVCIVTTTNRSGREIFKKVGFGKPTTTSVLEKFSGMLEKQSVVYTDGAFSYEQLVKRSDCSLIQLKTYTAYNRAEHLNTLNHIYTLIKGQLVSFRGVATKYMNRYTSLFVFIRHFLRIDNKEKPPLI